MRTVLLLATTAGLIACELTNEPNKGPEYKGLVSGTIVETVVHPTGQGVFTCKFDVRITGVAWVGLESEGAARGDGGVNLQFVSASRTEGDPAFCGGLVSLGQTGDWTTSAVGTASTIQFEIRRTDANPGGNFSASYVIKFTGGTSSSSISGPLTITRSTSLTQDGRATTSTASGDINVQMMRCDNAGSCGF